MNCRRIGYYFSEGGVVEHTTSGTMSAVVIDRFGGVETLVPRRLPIPEIGPDQVLVRVESAGVGTWDIFEREGGFAEIYPGVPVFPYVLGSEGAGTVVSVGEKVDRFRKGDRVCGFIGIKYPKSGFYAEYAAVDADNTWPIPHNLAVEAAGAMPIDAGTALRGLRDVLDLKQGETLMIFGAGGGVGHLAVQLARRMGIRVLAVVSGEDGVKLAQLLGAEKVVEGHEGDFEVHIARTFPLTRAAEAQRALDAHYLGRLALRTG